MKKTISFILVFIFILSVSSIAFAQYHEYSGGASSTYFDTRALNRGGTSWSYFRDKCTSSMEYEGAHYASPHLSHAVNGNVALTNQKTVWGGQEVTLTMNASANNYSSAKLRLSITSTYGEFYAIGRFYAI